MDLASTATSTGTLKFYSDSAAMNELGSTSVSASGTYYVQATQNGCVSAIESISVTINSLPTVSVSQPAATCATNVDLASTATSTGTLKFYADSAAMNELGSTSVSASGTYYVQATQNGCVSAIESISVTINSLPTVSVSQPAATCATNVDLASTATSTGTLKFYADSAAMNELGSTSVSASGTYYVQATQNGCVSAIESISVTINSLPTVSVSQPAATCATDVDLAATVTSAGTLKFYADSAAMTELMSSTVTTSGTYYVQATQNGCVSTIESISVTINSLPTVSVSPICGYLCYRCGFSRYGNIRRNTKVLC